MSAYEDLDYEEKRLTRIINKAAIDLILINQGNHSIDYIIGKMNEISFELRNIKSQL